MPHAKITGLNLYPVKSCRGIAVESVTLTDTGFAFDRRWMVVDENGRFQTQRELPRLAVIHTQLSDGRLRLSANDMPDLVVGDPGQGERREVKVWNDQCSGLDAGDAAAGWLSQFLHKKLRLLSFDTSTRRACDPSYAGDVPATTMFADAFPFLVLSESSLINLNRRLDKTLPMNRFRPNIVLNGVQAHEEDRIRELRAGDVCIRLVKPCDRCSITTTDQVTGLRRGDEPLRTLKSYRWDPKLRGVTFGQNGILVSGAGASLRVGQEFDITWA
ncbi:MAG: MOSC N-terminal beta barrel domain-containing protein [Steroidobacteraceae bacterium]